jgi:hypothetical protein
MDTKEICYCKKDIISVCTAKNVTEQKKCRFYQRSSFSDKCMYLVLDKFCDNIDAQASEKK